LKRLGGWLLLIGTVVGFVAALVQIEKLTSDDVALYCLGASVVGIIAGIGGMTARNILKKNPRKVRVQK